MNYILGVCGSIAAYKSYDLLRLLIKNNHQVKVVLTKGAEQFVHKDLFKYLGASEVYWGHDDFENNQEGILHINLKNWCDRLLIAPASANTLAKLAFGMCDDLLTSVYLCCEDKEKIIFPAMNTSMYENTLSQENRKRLLKVRKTHLVAPESGLLACGEEGQGKLPLPEDIFQFLESFSMSTRAQTVLITTGATKAPLDPVRYLTNPATGKTGIEIAKLFLRQGFQVQLVHGEEVSIDPGLKLNPNLDLIAVKTTAQMYQAVDSRFYACDYFISSAAVSDIQFESQNQKLKKDQLSSSSISFSWDTDILAQMIRKKQNQVIISFAAETDLNPDALSVKHAKKPSDLFIANKVSNGILSEREGFGDGKNEYHFMSSGKFTDSAQLSKQELAQYIFKFTEELKNAPVQ